MIGEIASVLPAGIAAKAPGTSGRGGPVSLGERWRRLKHELLWPRILVRHALPQDVTPLIVPERPAKRLGRRAFSRD